jgi:hypothetical protein
MSVGLFRKGVKLQCGAQNIVNMLRYRNLLFMILVFV